MANVINLGWGNLAESSLHDPNPLTLDSNIGRLAGVIQYQTVSDATTDAVVFYPPGIITGSAQICTATLKVEVIAIKDDHSVCGSWCKGMTMKWDAAGASTVVGAVYEMRAEQGASGYAVTLVSFAAGISLRITGAAATTVNWVINWEMLSLDNIA